MRKRALSLLVKAILEEETFRDNSVLEGLTLTEIARQIKEFELAEQFLMLTKEAFNKMDSEFDPPMRARYKKAIEYAERLIDKRDWKFYCWIHKKHIYYLHKYEAQMK
ncbi:MAG: hypothetical protein ABGX27_03835 [Desulfurobacteriaceae bacterium]